MTNLTPVASFKQELGSPSQMAALASVLPEHIDVKSFCRITMMAVQNAPALLDADRNSLFASLQRCATDGLIPDGKEAALIEFNTKDKASGKYIKKIQYLPMVAGILKRARQSGQIATIAARCVYDNDEFDYWIDENGEHMMHRPNFGGDRGNMRLVYAMAKMTSGEVVVEPMDMNEIQKVKDASKTSKYGAWVDWFERMAEKSALHRLTRRLPNSSELSEMMNRDGFMYDFNKKEVDVTPEKESLKDRLAPKIEVKVDEKEIENSEKYFKDLAMELIHAAKSCSNIEEVKEVTQAVAGSAMPDKYSGKVNMELKNRKKELGI